MKEEWRDVPGLEGRYKVSNLGMVKRLPRKVIRSNGKPYTVTEKIWPGSMIGKPGYTPYYKIGIEMDGVVESWMVHRLVAMVFLGDIDGMDIDHIDHNGLNNRVDNLRIVTRRANQGYRKNQGKSPFVGVGIHTNKKKDYALIYITSQIICNGKKSRIGFFNTEEDAYLSYLWALAMIKWGMPERIYEYMDKYYEKHPEPRYVSKVPL